MDIHVYFFCSRVSYDPFKHSTPHSGRGTINARGKVVPREKLPASSLADVTILTRSSGYRCREAARAVQSFDAHGR